MRARYFLAEILFLWAASAVAADPLRGYGADVSHFTVSGISSGGYMAVQMQVAHSARVTGVGALAAGPYYCAQGSLWAAQYPCMSPGFFTSVPRLELLKSYTDRFAAEHLIDSTGNLAKARVWLFSGTEDRTVKPEVVEALGAFYRQYGAKPAIVKTKPAGHAMVTEDAGNDCGVTETPYINRCKYDAAGELLEHLLPKTQPRAAKAAGRVLAFDQQEFGASSAISMAQTGYVYVPPACEKESCRVHVAFHGCRQGADQIGERFVREAGYNRWADSNRLIILYPQAVPRYVWWIFNPRGCWDWWGYTGSRYATKEGPQIRAVVAMVERLGQPRK